MPAQHRKWLTGTVAIFVLTPGRRCLRLLATAQARLSPHFDMSNGRLEVTEVQIASKTAGRLAQVISYR